MIVRRTWERERRENIEFGVSETKHYTYDVWFLFGIIPFYIHIYED